MNRTDWESHVETDEGRLELAREIAVEFVWAFIRNLGIPAKVEKKRINEGLIPGDPGWVSFHNLPDPKDEDEEEPEVDYQDILYAFILEEIDVSNDPWNNIMYVIKEIPEEYSGARKKARLKKYKNLFQEFLKLYVYLHHNSFELDEILSKEEAEDMIKEKESKIYRMEALVNEMDDLNYGSGVDSGAGSEYSDSE